ncbi:DUF488 domain-containing protein [Clostridium estertheticum]|uniref:DUF488 domain-containing protein n=1 Tax=Clostridium estertheticum TaxID=238834 RepID=A0A5N7IXL8_9CLOT|nr:DUF488 domain-containing protein [Clostridium estertheticum]MPQ30548.1 DUF488 domain-containing protein [Clostridium estertheticum]MPQ61224.1 DUF488 domain-containing protein [Clostridium estertheticum]
MKLYTIGFTKKSASEFFTLLKNNNIRVLVDIRLNNVSQLAGYTKRKDLEYFLTELLSIRYIHDLNLAPTKQILDDYKKKVISWEQYEKSYIELLNERNIQDNLNEKYNKNFENVCLLCSESTPENCHRRLAAEYIKKLYSELDIEIVHL